MFRTLAAATFMALAATSAGAVTLTIDSVSFDWETDDPGVFENGDGNLRWGGIFLFNSRAGYDFDVTTDLPVTVGEGEAFSIGEFTHLNEPVTSVSFESAELLITTHIEGFIDPIVTVYTFEHLETPNRPLSSDPDPTEVCDPGNGELNAQGLNEFGCADVITVSLDLEKSDTFFIDDSEYVFDVLGFGLEDGESLVFYSTETMSNSVELVTELRNLTPVPLPASVTLMLAGLGGLTFVRSRRKRAAA